MINSIVFLNKNDQVQMCDNESYKYNWISTINSAEVKYNDKSIGYIVVTNNDIDKIDMSLMSLVVSFIVGLVFFITLISILKFYDSSNLTFSVND